MGRRTLTTVAVALAVLAGCSSGGSGTASGPATTGAGGPCPADPVEVVVTVNQWGDIASRLGGGCARVTTVIQGADVDPHEFEPTPADNAAFTRADLVVLNGLGYDHWAEDVLATLSPLPAVVDAWKVAGLTTGDNPHVWYSPAYVQQVAQALTTELSELAPGAAGYFAERATAWDQDLQPYRNEVEVVKGVASGKTYVATESVFDDMAQAVGLVNVTPQGYQEAAANESDPSPADINAFEDALRSGSVAALVYNTQTQGSVPEQLRGVAEKAGVPVVEVTESVPPGRSSFVGWQVAQLQSLAAALSG